MAVYFVQAGEGGLIKIGVARNVASRMVKMQVDSPVPLKLLGAAPGDAELEREYHRRFASHRVRGEWFAPATEIIEEAARHPYQRPRRSRTYPQSPLASYLQERRMTASQLAERIGCSPATISRVLNGVDEPGIELLRAIRRATGGAIEPNHFLTPIQIRQPRAKKPRLRLVRGFSSKAAA